MQPSVLAKRAWFVLFTIIAAFYFWGLGSLPLLGADEPRYAQVAREMLARHDLITPTLGGLPWFEKPSLLYWLMMASFKVLGVNEYAARLGPAICGLLTAVFVYWIGKSVDLSHTNQASVQSPAPTESVGHWSALVWLSSAGAIAFSRGASFDSVLTMTVSGALAAFFGYDVSISVEKPPACGLLASLAGASQRGRHVLLLFTFYFFVGLSLLAKGLIGPVIIFGTVAAYSLVRRQLPTGRFLKSLWWGIPLAFAVASFWYGPVLARHGRVFIDQFIIEHHFARFLSNRFHHPAPFYFYVPVVLILALPWTAVFGAALVSSRRWKWRGSSSTDRLRVLALVWILVPLIFFSLSESKLIGYIMPALPAVALLAGERIACFIAAQRGARVARLSGVLLLLLAAVGVGYGSHQFRLSAICLGFTAAPMLIAGCVAVIRPRPARLPFLLIVIAAIATSVSALRCAAPAAARGDSTRDLFATAAARGYVTTPVVQLHDLDRTAEFYAAGRISYGSDGMPLRFEGVTQVLDAAQHNGGAVLCLVPLEYETQLTTYKVVATERIGDNGRVVLLAVHAK